MHHNRFASLARVSTNLFIVLVLIFSMFLGVTQKAAAQGDETLLARSNEDRIEGNEWPLGSTVSVEIDDPQTGQSPEKTVSAVVGTAPWDDNLPWFEIQLTDYDLKPGDVITATDGVTPKQLIVKNIQITDYDLEAETVTGMADPGQLMFIQACVDSTCANRDETADQNGNWSTNFSIPGEQGWEQDTADLQGGTWLDANINDADGDMSRFGLSIPNPAINVLVNSDRVGGNEWPLGETLIIEIDDPTTIDVNPDFEATATVDSADWDPNQTWFEIGLDGYDLKTGDIVTISGGGFSKQLTIQTLAITEVDLDTDTVYGVAEPNQQVEVVTCYSDCINQNATADQDGNWFSSFSSVGDESANIRGGSWVAVVVHDEDDDTTRFGYGIPNPTVTARANDDAIEGYQWPLGETVVLEIDDPNTPLATPDYTQSTVAAAADWDPNQTWLPFQPISYDIKTGDIVTVSDGSTTKQLIVANLAITEVDLGADVVHGTADPDQAVSVSVCGTDFCIFRDEMADSSGNWSANFAVPSPGNGPEDTIDIQSGIWIDAFIWDEDSDTTSFGLTAAPPACLPGDSVSGTIFEHDGVTPVPFANLNFEEYDTREILLTGSADENGQFSCILPEGNYRVFAWADGYSGEYFEEAADDNSAQIQVGSGTQMTGIDFTIAPLPAVEHLAFNLENPILQELAVRQAIALGTDRQRILSEAFLPNDIFGRVLNSIVPPQHWASAPDSGLTLYSYDPVQARSLLASAGWVDTDNDGYRENAQGTELSFTFKTTVAAFRAASADVFAENMESIGIRITIELVPAGQFFGPGGTIDQQDFDIAQFAWANGADNEPYLTEYLSTSRSNDVSYNNPSFDAAIANARAESSEAGKLPFLHEAQVIFMQDLPSLPLFTRIDGSVPTIGTGTRPNHVFGDHWPIGDTITLTIDDPSNGPSVDYQADLIAEPAPWDPSQGHIDHYPVNFQIQPGYIIQLANEDITKTLIVTYIEITSVDTQTDIVTGLSDSNVQITVGIEGEPFGGTYRRVTTGSDGAWFVDFSLPDPYDSENILVDIEPGMNAVAVRSDEDRDLTEDNFTAETPACLPGNSVSGTVFEHDRVTPVPDAAVQFEDFTTGEVLLTTVTDANGQYGCNLPSGNYRALAWPNDGYSSEYYLEAAGDNAAELQITTGTQLSGIDFTVSPLPGVEHLSFNFDNPLLQDPGIREAIALGTNRQQILTESFLAHNEFGTILNSIVPLEHWASAPVSELEIYSFDPVQAQSLLAAAGWTDTDNDGFRENAQDVELSFTFKTTPAPVRVDAAELFRQNMEAIGIRIIVETVPAGEFFGSGGTLEQGDFDIAEFAWVGGADNEPYLTEYLSTSISSVGGYSSAAFDAAIANARAESSDDAKLPFLYEAQGILTQDLPIFPLFTRLDVAPVATDPGTGVTVSPETYLDITFDEVTDGGVTTVLSLDIDPADLPPNFEVLGQVYDVGTNAQFTSAQVCFSYDDAGLTQVQEDAIRLFHLENNVWVDVTDAGYPDTVNNLVCGTVTSFSPFAIVYGLNQAPQITSLSAPLNPTQLGQTITATALFDDPDAGDTHTALFDWGDGSTTTLPASTPSVSAFHTYAAPGVYTITVTVTDAVGESDTETFQYIVVYDPNGGFVTGGGWITSPLGAYTLDPSLTGKATFGFVSKYQKGANVPTGSTEFQFHVANMNFKSTAYDWLVIAGSKAQYKGTGTINGTGEYKFMLTAIDGSPDKFRIKIWDASTGDVVYDNQLGAGDTDDPVTAIQGGSIVIHKPK